jgi:hypothetical protein
VYIDRKVPLERAISQLRNSKETIDKFLANEQEMYDETVEDDKFSERGMKLATRVSNLELVSEMINQTIQLTKEILK